jgi:DNA-binding protein HU-beta
MASKRMTQAELVGHFATKFNLKRAQAKGVFDELAALAASEVKKNGEFTIPGIGKVVTAKRKARTGRNPATGEAIKIAAKTVTKFRIAKALSDAVGSKKK